MKRIRKIVVYEESREQTLIRLTKEFLKENNLI